MREVKGLKLRLSGPCVEIQQSVSNFTVSVAITRNLGDSGIRYRYKYPSIYCTNVPSTYHSTLYFGPIAHLPVPLLSNGDSGLRI